MFFQKSPRRMRLPIVFLLGLSWWSLNLAAQELDTSSAEISEEPVSTDSPDVTPVPENAPDPTQIADKKALVFSAGFSASSALWLGWTDYDKVQQGLSKIDPYGGVIISTTLS